MECNWKLYQIKPDMLNIIECDSPNFIHQRSDIKLSIRFWNAFMNHKLACFCILDKFWIEIDTFQTNFQRI